MCCVERVSVHVLCGWVGVRVLCGVGRCSCVV